LELDRDIGLLLPFSVVVYEDGEETVIAAIDPIALFSLADGSQLREIALEAKEKLRDAINHVAAGVA
jgi:uncharacterized protein (DUF302 family)